ncbi:4'-phosphopantetheinyl transferase family protein [Streptomyces sp. NBC_00859]|uniref:4'-phosphopantetheinyl transferase family protein n=1 Tax=Streptomyces sp. NBC_00859 TaxID=2903682 RepID=UPI00386B2263|nr:4'-phosphopantetheinyl transferase superfamily protein [Streptomyces sp. NBC_00859]
MIDTGALPKEFGHVRLPSGPLRGVEMWLASSRHSPSGDISVLDVEERRRAEGFRRASDRNVYITAHSALRSLIGAYLGRDPAALRFRRENCPGCGGKHGRPALAGEAGSLHFSLSHSADLALIAFALTPVGTDIEAVPGAETTSEASTALHPDEQRELSHLPDRERPFAFARCWTRKEAYVKGTGEGVAGPGFAATIVGSGERPLPLPGWTLIDVRVPKGFAAACAVRR